MSVRTVVENAYWSALPTLLGSALGGLLAGSMLAGLNEELAAVQGLLVMVPAFLAIRGSVYGSLGSRLSLVVHFGSRDQLLTCSDQNEATESVV
jgi:mgtE-like transporter